MISNSGNDSIAKNNCGAVILKRLFFWLFRREVEFARREVLDLRGAANPRMPDLKIHFCQNKDPEYRILRAPAAMNLIFDEEGVLAEGVLHIYPGNVLRMCKRKCIGTKWLMLKTVILHEMTHWFDPQLNRGEKCQRDSEVSLPSLRPSELLAEEVQARYVPPQCWRNLWDWEEVSRDGMALLLFPYRNTIYVMDDTDNLSINSQTDIGNLDLEGLTSDHDVLDNALASGIVRAAVRRRKIKAVINMATARALADFQFTTDNQALEVTVEYGDGKELLWHLQQKDAALLKTLLEI